MVVFCTAAVFLSCEAFEAQYVLILLVRAVGPPCGLPLVHHTLVATRSRRRFAAHRRRGRSARCQKENRHRCSISGIAPVRPTLAYAPAA